LDDIRILLLNVRGVLGDVIKAMLRASEDVTVVGESLDVTDIRALVDRTGADVVVCQFDDIATAEVANGLFAPHRRVKVIAVRDDGRRAVLWELRPQRSELGDLSPSQLVDVVRQTDEP
jgi:DNA-binding NarL/FixJ family response regulator